MQNYTLWATWEWWVVSENNQTKATEIYIYGIYIDAIIASLEDFRKTYPLYENSVVRKLNASLV